MPGKECPCRDCIERKLGCHGHCDRYQTWKANFESAKHDFAMANIRADIPKGMMKYLHRRMKEGRMRK